MKKNLKYILLKLVLALHPRVLHSSYLKLFNYAIQNKQENKSNGFHVNFVDTSRHYVPDWCSWMTSADFLQRCWCWGRTTRWSEVPLQLVWQHHFLHMGQRFPHQLPVLENVILLPHVRRVACDYVIRTIFFGLLSWINMYKKIFIPEKSNEQIKNKCYEHYNVTISIYEGNHTKPYKHIQCKNRNKITS